MLNLKDIWIGENVKVISSGHIGKYEGIANDGRARISRSGKIYLVRPVNLEIYAEPEIDKVEMLKQELKQDKSSTILKEHKTQIDLHINTLNPTMSNALPEHILNYQLSACKSFINDCIDAKSFSVTIVHGKGAGVLRMEVLEILKGIKEAQLIEEVNNGGAQRIYFKY